MVVVLLLFYYCFITFVIDVVVHRISNFFTFEFSGALSIVLLVRSRLENVLSVVLFVSFTLEEHDVCFHLRAGMSENNNYNILI